MEIMPKPKDSNDKFLEFLYETNFGGLASVQTSALGDTPPYQ
jgi:hypothetical protein